MLSFFGCGNNVVVRSLLLLPGKVEKQWWMELLENVKKWMYKLLKLFLVLSFGGIASGGKSGLPEVLEWEIKVILGIRDYLQLLRGFIRKKEFLRTFAILWELVGRHILLPLRDLRTIPCNVGYIPAEPYVLLKWVCLPGLSVCPSEAISSPAECSLSWSPSKTDNKACGQPLNNCVPPETCFRITNLDYQHMRFLLSSFVSTL